MSASETPVHTCSYSCQRPECMNAQRTELLAKLAEQAVRMRELEAALKRLLIAGKRVWR